VLTASLTALVLLASTVTTTRAQDGTSPPPGEYGVVPGVKVGGSPNVHLLRHLPLGGYFAVMDLEIEQEMSRPYAYVCMSTHDGAGFTIIDLRDLNNIHELYRWRIENNELHGGTGGMDGKYFKLNTKTGPKYYYVQSLQFGQSGPDADLGAVVADVTGLPDTTKVKIVARIRAPETPGGFHNMFAYKHSSGRVLLFTTVSGPYANIYDMEKLLAGDPKQGLVGRVPIPSSSYGPVALQGFRGVGGLSGYHDFYVGYDPATHQDKFYGAGAGGFYVYDITNIDQPKLLTSIVGASGITGGHTFTPTPDGHYAVAETEYQYAPLRIFDLQPGLEGKVPTINAPVGAWNSDWHDLAHNHEVRWPYVFVSAYEDGLQIFDMGDPANPQTVGWYFTCMCKHESGFGGIPGWQGASIFNGAFGVDIRNADGLIVLSDSHSGFWAFKLDGFSGWNGEKWGMPNISSVQDWDHGPTAVKAPRKIEMTP
jgi:hypothetical protein